METNDFFLCVYCILTLQYMYSSQYQAATTKTDGFPKVLSNNTQY